MDQLIRPKDLEDWLNSSTTKQFLELVKEHKEASKDYINLCLLETASLAKLDLHQIAEYRGQVNAFDRILDLEEFIKEKVELPKEEIKNEEDDGIRRVFNN